MTRVIVGVGCDRGTALDTLQTALHAALAESRLTLQDVAALATIDKKSDELGILELARLQGWLVHYYDATQLSTVPVPNPSETVRKYMGTPAVAEAAAMLSAKCDISGLVVEKFKYRGSDNKNATISIARIEHE